MQLLVLVLQLKHVQVGWYVELFPFQIIKQMLFQVLAVAVAS
jgi:hypothetical protein